VPIMLDSLKVFLQRDKGLQPATVNFNLKLMRRILKDCIPFNHDTFSKLVLDLIDRGRDRSYINQHIVVIHYWGQIHNIPEFKDYPFYKGKVRERLGEDEYVRTTMADEEVEAFLALPNPWSKGGLYWRRFEMWTVFWYICAYHGCRMGEAAALRKLPTKQEPGHVDFGRNLIVFFGKTGAREVPLSFVAREKLLDYVNNLVDGDYLFPSIRKSAKPYVGDVAWGGDFRKRIRRLNGQFSGIKDRLNLEPYSLRHSFGTRQADENWALPKIQKAMGHRKLDTTAKYIHMSLKAVADMIDNDRLALPHKSGADINQHFLDFFREAEKRYRRKVLINITKSRGGKKIVIKSEAIDGE